MSAMTTAEHNKHRAAIRYLGGIRNPFKRTYGVKYWGYLNDENPCPESGDISYMAAQAVRMRLHDIKAGLPQDYQNWPEENPRRQPSTP